MIDAHIAAAPDAEVVGLPDVREVAVVHVDVRQNLGVSRGQNSEIRHMALRLVVEVLALQPGFKELEFMFPNRRGHCDFGVVSIGSLIAHLKILATNHLAHLHHKVVAALRHCHVMARPLLFTMAAIVVPLPVQIQERAVV